ncbi:MAG: hypothetical protein KJ000_09750 [Pirellulaceae bacterium]|nr:hypothetical protein [Pirellulaceae bacterium]
MLLVPAISRECRHAAGAEAQVSTEALVQMLGDEQFSAREQATTKLIEIGLEAKSALEQGSQHPDREIRYRCVRILTIIGEMDFQRRLDAFAEGRDDEHGLPGWDHYRESIGTSTEARALFVEMQKAEPDIMRAIEMGPQEVGKTLTQRCIQIQQLQSVARQAVSLGSIAAMLFAVANDKVDVRQESGAALSSLCYQPEVQNAMNDGSRRPIVRRLLGDWIKRGDSWAAFQNLSLAMRYDMEEGLVPARKVLENPANPPYIRQNGILAIAKLGDRSDVPLLEGLLEDQSRLATQRIGDKTFETRLRDVALAAILLLEGKDPKDFGFDRIQRNDMSVFVIATVGFPDDEQRLQTLKMFQDSRAANDAKPDP